MRAAALTRLSPALRPRGLVLWFAVLAGIAAWAAHILLVSALVQWTCNEEGSRWVIDALTLVTAAATVLAMWLCVGIVRGADEDEAGEDTGEGAAGARRARAARMRFLGIFGLLTGAFNLALILLEGSYAWFISPCA